MNSEKVKEIKEKLQEEIFIANSFGDKIRKVLTKELENLLTLINELESENESLHNAKVIFETVDYCAEDLRKAQDRIAQLEQENEYLKKGSSGLLESIRHASAQVIKLFADELLKVAHNSNGTIRECDVNDILKRYSVFRGVEE